MFCLYTNCPTPPLVLPDMCEMCESVRNENSAGHHTYIAIHPGSCLTGGKCIWFCSKTCFNMSDIPTIDDGRWT